MVGPAFRVELQLNKDVHDPLFGINSFATTWQTGTLGTHGRREDYIISAIRELMDHFVNEWFKANKPDGKCVE